MRKLLPALLLCIAITACNHQSDPASTESGITTLLGQPTTLEETIAGQPAIINFWASWCAFCKDEMPELEAVYEQYGNSLSVIGVNLQEEQAVARAYADQGGYTFPMLLDPASELKQRFAVFTQPTTIVLAADGTEVVRKDGPFTAEELATWAAEAAGSPAIDSDRDSGSDRDSVLDSSADTSPPPPLLQSWYQGEVAHTIDLKKILGGGPAKDGIPSIDNPKFIQASAADPNTDGLLGLLLTSGNDTRFYPFAILNWHEIVNDTVGGTPVSITYCPLCASAVAYHRGEDTFGVSGLLYQSNLLMYDRGTESLWSQITGEAVVGPLVGKRLKRLKSDIVTLGTVKQNWPSAQVLTTETGHARDYNRDPYEGYSETPAVYFPVGTVDERLESKALVYGVVVDGLAKAYPLSTIKSEERIQDSINGQRVLVQYDSDTDRVRFVRFFEGDQTEEIVPIYGFWFSWVAQYPETLVYTSD